MSNNYPAGTQDDSRAPWNQSDSENYTKVCTECNGESQIPSTDENDNDCFEVCPICYATGRVDMDDEEIKEAELNDAECRKEDARGE